MARRQRSASRYDSKFKQCNGMRDCQWKSVPDWLVLPFKKKSYNERKQLHPRFKRASYTF